MVDAMAADAGAPLTALKVDGGMTANDLLMQFQADVLDVPGGPAGYHRRPRRSGAAYAAGLAVGFWPDLATLKSHWRKGHRMAPGDGPGDARSRIPPVEEGRCSGTLNWVD
ncbi:MAG: FGGY-family carbohydrate kinase [Caulobacteraceae bacterium]